ncbi:hypothetical protein [Paenibacillus sp. MER TA 81-3]|nr:hypothetical protein [Paenibacillus sp. MER TA 81-3]
MRAVANHLLCLGGAWILSNVVAMGSFCGYIDLEGLIEVSANE